MDGAQREGRRWRRGRVREIAAQKQCEEVGPDPSPASNQLAETPSAHGAVSCAGVVSIRRTMLIQLTLAP